MQKPEALAALKTLKKISQLTWDKLYQDQGLKWEMIYSKKGRKGETLYSFRITQKCRGIGIREGDYLRLLSLHSEHDSAYQ